MVELLDVHLDGLRPLTVLEQVDETSPPSRTWQLHLPWGEGAAAGVSP